MLHEILLSLSGHPSPLLTADHASSSSILSPPEKALLASLAHLSDLHYRLLTQTKAIAASHPSSICQAVSTAISSTHLAQFQRKILEVEDGILRRDAGYVGAYNIVPLTAIVGEFSGWTRRMEWFMEIVEFMARGSGGDKKCSGAMIIDKLCSAMQTGYGDIEDAALSLVRVAETAWLKQVTAWILYGRLPTFGRADFFIQAVSGDTVDYESIVDLLPPFVSPQTASSVLFIGRSLNHLKVKGISSMTSPDLQLLSSHQQQLYHLEYPLKSASFSRAVATIRLSLSQKTLQKLLPLSRVVEIVGLLREFFLLGRGEFAMALINEADEKIRSRWRQSENLAYEKRDALSGITMKDGEVSAVLARTWAALGALQGSSDDQDEDDQLDLARDLINLVITKADSSTPSKPSSTSSAIASTPFSSLLLSVPVLLTLPIPSPLDLFLSPSDITTYSHINAYLLSIRRAHLRLTDLWKITSLRRDHPAPPGPPYGSSTAGRNKVHTLRKRATERSRAMRSVWATSSAAVFFLGETEAYLQGEVVGGSWSGFLNWLTGERTSTFSQHTSRPKTAEEEGDEGEEEDIWLKAARDPAPPVQKPTHDPQTLSHSHRLFLKSLTRNLLLTTSSFTDPLYNLLQQIDHLVALIHRIHSIWSSLDLEADEGVVDAFSDFHKEERDVMVQLRVVGERVREGVISVVGALREVDQEHEGWDGAGLEGDMEGLDIGDEKTHYVPAKVGRVDRLLMKLDFGSWIDGGKAKDGSDDDDFYDL